MRNSTTMLIRASALSAIALLGVQAIGDDVVETTRDVWRTEFTFPDLENYIVYQSPIYDDGAPAEMGGAQMRVIITPDDNIKCATHYGVFNRARMWDLSDTNSVETTQESYDIRTSHVDGAFEATSSYVISNLEPLEFEDDTVFLNGESILMKLDGEYYNMSDKLGFQDMEAVAVEIAGTKRLIEAFNCNF